VNRTTIVFAAGLALAAALPVASAQALSARTFVSGHGNDANTCLYAAPCRTFAGAYAKTAAGGEITVLDPAGYGPLTIGKALSIVNDGVGETGVILIAAGNAITINAGAADAVSLRGLTLDGGGIANTYGIVFSSGASLTVQNCVVRHFGQYGLQFGPNTDANLIVSDTVVADNGNDGIHVEPPGSASVTAVFNRVELVNNPAIGLHLDSATPPGSGTISATFSESVAAKNGAGILVVSFAPRSATLTIVNSVVANHSGAGIQAWGAGIVRVFRSMVTGNGHGWMVNNGGTVESYGNNAIDGNDADETAPPSVAQK
jgi:hypothetical protein